MAAAAPDKAPFMADECLKAIPAIEGIDYTAKEYLNFVDHIQNTTDRLNSECKLIINSNIQFIFMYYLFILTFVFYSLKVIVRIHYGILIR